MLLEELHAPTCVGKTPPLVKTASIKGRIGQVRLQERVAMLDLRSLRHYSKKPPCSLTSEQRASVIDERVVDIARGDGGANLVDVGGCHARFSKSPIVYPALEKVCSIVIAGNAGGVARPMPSA
jgi:hypothetical protein